MGSQSKDTGRLGETLALKFLQNKGYQLVTRNYHIRGGEIDLIMVKEGILVFVEVKTRRNELFGVPEESLTVHKQRSLIRTIYHYLHDHPRHPWRCDLIAIRLQGNSGTITHYRNILHE